VSVPAALLEPFPHKTLWTMQRQTHRLTAEVVCTDGHWELRLFAQHQLITWRRFAQRVTAVAYADLLQQDLERDGWQ